MGETKMTKRLKLRMTHFVKSLQGCRSEKSVVPSKVLVPATSPQFLSKTFSTHIDSLMKLWWLSEEEWNGFMRDLNVSTRRKISISFSDEFNSELARDLKNRCIDEKGKQKIGLKKRVNSSFTEHFQFSNDDNETVVSSISLSTGSTHDSKQSLRTMQDSSAKSKTRNQNKVMKNNLPESFSPARLSVFRHLIPCSLDGKVRDSFAIVKKSNDPYIDFKRSMIDMILEKQMFDVRDLEKMLHCFLSLNSQDLQSVIIQAFSEIWADLFSKSATYYAFTSSFFNEQ